MNANRLCSIAVAAAGLTLATAAPALADTFCVHQGTGCAPGELDQGDSVQDALTAAALNPGVDTVVVGPGTYTGPADGFKANVGHDLVLEGAGPATVLRAPTAAEVLHANGADVSDLAIETPTGTNVSGIYMAGGSIADVTVTGGGTHIRGLELIGDVSAERLTVDVSAGSGSVGVYLGDHLGAAPILSDSTITARTGITSQSGSVTSHVRRVTITATNTGVYSNGSDVRVESSVIRGEGAYRAFSASCSGVGDDATLVGDHLTIVGTGSQAVNADCSTSGASAATTVTNSFIASGYGTTLDAWQSSGGTASSSAAWSMLAPNETATSGGATVALGDGIADLTDPLFAGGDDVRPLAGSPLVDAGDPAPASSPALDRDGSARSSGGRVDIGAYELQQPEPQPAPAAGGGAPSGGGGGGSTATPEADDVPAPGAETPAPTGAEAPSAQLPAPAISADAIRAALREAITGRKGRDHTVRILAPGSVRFAWRAKGRTLARGAATVVAPGIATVTVAPTKAGRRALRRAPRVNVRATFVPATGTSIGVRARLARR